MVRVEIDYAGIGEIAKGDEVRAMVDAAAERIADHVKAEAGGVPVVVDHYTTDREAAAVVIADNSGMGLQAKHGVLTRAASSVGAEVVTR